MSDVTNGTTPHRAQTWNAAVRVPNAYSAIDAGSRTVTVSVERGFDVQTPPCLTQNVQPHARAGIVGVSSAQSSSNAMLPQFSTSARAVSSTSLVDRRLEQAAELAGEINGNARMDGTLLVEKPLRAAQAEHAFVPDIRMNV